jgi:hypothetical protein
MDMKSSQYKVKDDSSSKPMLTESDKISVTQSEVVTDILINSPRKRYRELEPWLRLTNLLPPNSPHPASAGQDEVERFYQAAVHAFPEPEYLTGTERAARKAFPGVKQTPRAVFFLETHFVEPRAKLFYALAYATRETFEFLHRAQREIEGGELFSVLPTAAYRREFIITPAGRLAEREDLFHGKFVSAALAGIEISRLMRCEVCQAFMYAVRRGQEACSKRCNDVRRVRRWRQKQARYEQNRKFRSAGVSPKGSK